MSTPTRSSVHVPAPLHALQASSACAAAPTLIATDSQNSVAAVGQAFAVCVGLFTPAQNTLAVAVAVPPGPITVSVYVFEPVSANAVVPLQLTPPPPLSPGQSPVVASA